MCKLKVTDFYYGSFLSAFLNNPSCRPSLFDDSEARNIFRLETDNCQEGYIFFAKFVSKKAPDMKKRWHWTFQFSDAEVTKLKELSQQCSNVKLALICAKDGLKDSELAIVDYDQAMDCLGVDVGLRTYKIDIKTIPGQHGLRMYGSGRSDKLNGNDNTLSVSRQELSQL